MWGAYFCMGGYKRDVVAEIKMVPIFIRRLFCVGDPSVNTLHKCT